MVSLYYVIQEMHSFSMRPAKYFNDKPLPNYIDPKTVLIYRQHPVYTKINRQIQILIFKYGTYYFPSFFLAEEIAF
jgi:hypothetical protein